jgi:hypothetical protein
VSLCRWLLKVLMSLDPGSLARQADPDDIGVDRLIAYMLGVRRECVTEAAYTFQQAGLIS